jgi:hypothetical protein
MLRGIMSSLDMTLESVYANTCTLLVSCSDPGDFNKQFYSNFCGELDDGGVQKYKKRLPSGSLQARLSLLN